jgi:hypothetical protein
MVHVLEKLVRKEKILCAEKIFYSRCGKKILNAYPENMNKVANPISQPYSFPEYYKFWFVETATYLKYTYIYYCKAFNP